MYGDNSDLIGMGINKNQQTFVRFQSDSVTDGWMMMKNGGGTLEALSDAHHSQMLHRDSNITR